MSLQYVLVFVSSSDGSSMSFRSAVWDPLRKVAEQDSKIQIVEVSANTITDPALVTTHCNLPPYVCWLPTLAIFDYDSWQSNSLVGSVYGGSIENSTLSSGLASTTANWTRSTPDSGVSGNKSLGSFNNSSQRDLINSSGVAGVVNQGSGVPHSGNLLKQTSTGAVLDSMIRCPTVCPNPPQHVVPGISLDNSGCHGNSTIITVNHVMTAETPIEWMASYLKKPKYVLVGVGGRISRRFQRGPWNKFVEMVEKNEKIGSRVIWFDDEFSISPASNEEFRHRWLDWTPFVGIFTKTSWNRGEDLVGWIFQGKVDNHWSCDKVAVRSSTDRYDEHDLYKWYLSVVDDERCDERCNVGPDVSNTREIEDSISALPLQIEPAIDTPQRISHPLPNDKSVKCRSPPRRVKEEKRVDLLEKFTKSAKDNRNYIRVDRRDDELSTGNRREDDPLRYSLDDRKNDRTSRIDPPTNRRSNKSSKDHMGDKRKAHLSNLDYLKILASQRTNDPSLTEKAASCIEYMDEIMKQMEMCELTQRYDSRESSKGSDSSSIDLEDSDLEENDEWSNSDTSSRDLDISVGEVRKKRLYKNMNNVENMWDEEVVYTGKREFPRNPRSPSQEDNKSKDVLPKVDDVADIKVTKCQGQGLKDEVKDRPPTKGVAKDGTEDRLPTKRAGEFHPKGSDKVQSLSEHRDTPNIPTDIKNGKSYLSVVCEEDKIGEKIKDRSKMSKNDGNSKNISDKHGSIKDQRKSSTSSLSSMMTINESYLEQLEN